MLPCGSVIIIMANFLKKKKSPETDAVSEQEAPEAKKKKRGKKEKGVIEKVADAKNVKEVEREYLTFDNLLKKVQQHMSSKYAVELYDSEQRAAMKKLIEQYMKDNNYYVPNMTLGDVSERLYVEMAEYSFLTAYLRRTDIEEININAWDDVQIIPARGKPFKSPEHFKSATHAIDVVKRLLHNNKITFDASKPIVTGFLGHNIRITATHTVVVGESTGVSASIRIVNPAKITSSQFIDNNTCTEEMYNFLVDCFIHGISQVYAGETGSGKTTFMADIMSHFPDYKRLITIEEKVREFNLIRRDGEGNVLNNVVHLVTRETDDPSKDVTMQRLLTACLTMHPNALCVAEMKSNEAWEAQEAARTGHTVLTTTHASSTHGIYSRLATLCLQKYAEVPYDIIISLVAEAFPLGIYMKQLEDGSRRLMEIAECVLTGHGEYTTRSLYRFDIVSEEKNADGSIEINGRFVKANPPTDAFMKRLRDNGVSARRLSVYGGN